MTSDIDRTFHAAIRERSEWMGETGTRSWGSRRLDRAAATRISTEAHTAQPRLAIDGKLRIFHNPEKIPGNGCLQPCMANYTHRG